MNAPATVSGRVGRETARTARTGAPSHETPQKSGISWGTISRPLPERVRAEVVERFKATGGDFARWKRTDWELICEAMIRVEDLLDVEHPSRKTDRDTLQRVRRALEVVLWP